jgi:heat-inducible transcriptional repressor
MSRLDPRKETLLRAVVVEYIESAEPVASDSLASKYEFGVKSATIRNVLAELSEFGYLEQPHTSAGRIPSDAGYRYFVDKLMVPKEPETSIKTTVKHATSDGEVLQELVTETTKALSRLTRLLSAATVIKGQNLTIKSAVVTAIGPHQALVVLALSNGHVETRMVEVPTGLTLTELGQVNEFLHSNLVGTTLRQAARQKMVTAGKGLTIEHLLQSVHAVFRSISKEMNKVTLTTEGEEYLFGKPEFIRDASLLAEILDDLKNTELLTNALSNSTPSQSITIGREHNAEQLRRLSMVKQSFYVGQDEAGVIAVVGPTRMAYDHSQALVRYAAKALSDALTKFFA